MAKFYKCRYCGNVIEKHHVGAGEIECCGLGMEELIPNTVDASGEKHIPVVEVKDGKYTYKCTPPLEGPEAGRKYVLFPEGDFDKEKENKLWDFKAGCFKISLKSSIFLILLL